MLQLGQAAKIISCALTALVISSCAFIGKKNSDDVDYRKRAAELARELRRKNAQLEDLKEKNQILSTRAERVKTTHVTTPLIQVAEGEAHTAVKSMPQRLPKKTVVQEAVSVSVPTENGDQLLYAKIVNSFEGRNQSELQKALKIFLKTYPDSPYADNAIYLNAMLSVQKSELTQAHRALDHLLKEYAHGNKAVSALFAKGALFKKEMKYAKARKAFTDVAKLYPGSPESLRVPVELRLVQHLEKAGRK